MTILGMSTRKFVVRAVYAAISVTINLVIWFFLVDSILGALQGFAPGLESTPILPFAIAISFFAGVRHLLAETVFGPAMGALAGIISALYLFILTGGGNLSLPLSDLPSFLGGLTLTIRFESLLFILMLPSLLSVVSNVLLAVHRSSGKEIDVQQME